MTIHDALESLHPTAEWVVRGDTLEWLDENVTAPTQAEIDTEIARLQIEYDSLAYARSRASAYPTNADFMEAYTEKEIGGVSTKWDAYVIAYNKVRTDNPK
jgi:hypothetical protein